MPGSALGIDTDENYEQMRQLWLEIALRMKEETVYCTDQHFIEHYLPPVPDTVDTKAITHRLREGKCSKKRIARPKAKKNKGTKCNDVKESAFAVLNDVTTAIRESVGASTSALQLRTIRGTELELSTRGCALKIDACAIADGRISGALRLTDVIVPIQLKSNNDEEQRQMNRLELVSAVVRILNDDIRRNFAFGITIEGDRISLWYFSRSHSVKAASFSYTKNPEKLLHVLTALSCATEAQLGYDPRITLLPDMSFLYEFRATQADKADNAIPQDAGSARPAPESSAVYFRITASIVGSDISPLRIAGHSTRVFSAVQVVSKSDPTPIADSKEMVIKDVWIAADSQTEAQIQDALFADIETFAQSADWARHPLLAEFSENEKEALGAWLPGQRYKELFLCAFREDVGEGCLPVHPEAWDSDEIFVENVATSGPDATAGARPVSDSPTTTPPDLVGKEIFASQRQRAFSSKKRCFFLFEDVCTRVSALPTLGHAMDVLRQTHLALVLMFCAGWVHRDISSGNVLATRKKGETSWQAKLADLEYARKFSSGDPSSTDPKTGTLYFMAWEIHSSTSLFDDEPIPDNASRRRQPPTSVDTNHVDLKVTKHTCAHDLESLWWLVLFIVTNFIAHQESYAHAWAYFEGNDFAARLWLLSGGGLPVLHPDLSDFVRPLKDVRNILRSGYRKTNPAIEVLNLRDFAGACATYLDFFRHIKKSEASWQPIPLLHSSTESKAVETPAAANRNVAQASNAANKNLKKRKRRTKLDTREPPRRSSRLAAKAGAKSQVDEPGPSKKARRR